MDSAAHYRQIIVNMSVMDDTDEKELERLRGQIAEYVDSVADKSKVKDIEVHLN